MDFDRARIINENFRARVKAQDFPAAKSHTTPQDAQLERAAFLELFDSQLTCRQVDLLARKLKEKQEGFYTIASSGHEGNAAIAKAFRKDDMAFLHYRSGAFMIQRAKYMPEIDMIYDQILSLVASREDPISGGRHKVFGSVPLFIPPQTSTIASHLPKALGAALSITQAKTLKLQNFAKLPSDSVILCSFGDASVNHSTAQGAFNAAKWIIHAKIPLPLVWVCEDNGIGISVATPPDWIESIMSHQSEITYIACDGFNLADVYQAANKAQYIARKKGQVVFLHMKTVRLLGHAGSDIESQYHQLQEIEANEKEDPLLHTARIIIENAWMSSEEIIRHYDAIKEKVEQAAARALKAPKLKSAQEIMAPIIPPLKNQRQYESVTTNRQTQSHTKTMAQCLNLALSDILKTFPNTVVFGEDVGKKGGVYRITADLQKQFGPARVFDTLLDEQTILGTAIGFAHNGFIPIPEIQFLAFSINAFDQIRGEAATLSFFSKGQYTNPMVIRIPSFAYQKGFGGHFHNDNAIAFLREIPGVMIACPSNAHDAALLLRQSVTLAHTQQRIVVFLEPIALYMNKEVSALYPEDIDNLPVGELGIEGDELSDIVIISYGNGMHLSRNAAKILEEEYHISMKLVDLRWLAPINIEQLKKEISWKSIVIIVDECRRTGSLSEWLVTWMVENIHPLPQIHRITAEDSFIPLGNAWEYLLPSAESIVDCVLALWTKQLKGVM